ncbi:MAG: type I DNA topoisomerase [Bacteroidales bacterium]|nr:type I DNA topoisomerase [Bacteroidales bacterium]
MENLVIVESPTKGGTIQKFLGKDYVVTSSKGHIRDLQEKKLSVDVEHGFTPEYVIPADKKKLVAELKKMAAGADMVWLASDEDREGEAISWHLYETLGLKPEKTKRIVFHEITKTAILNAIANPRDIDMNLVNAQQARRVLDRLVGFELSPVLWRKIQPKLSAGRVQSVALRLIVDREKEILAAKAEPFYRIEAAFHPEGTPAGVKVKALLDTRFNTLEEARKFLEDSIGAHFQVDTVEKKEGVRVPAAPFTTSTLQQEASRKLHFPVSSTMRVAQSLYERGLITYMRTDSTNLSGLAINTAKEFITEHYGPQYSKVRQYKTHSKGAQEAHEAIRPTYISNTDIEGTSQEKKLYALIWKRTVASQMADAQVLRTDIKVASDHRSERFLVQAQQVLFDGFLKVYMESSDDALANDEEVVLPEIATGSQMSAKSMEALCKFTPLPSRYSEATLIRKLEELGIGRPATYAQTISTLTTGRGYVIRGDKEGEKRKVTNLSLKGDAIVSKEAVETVGAEKGRLLPQEIGMIVTDYLTGNFENILDYDFTANVEKDFDLIAEGEQTWNQVISSFYGPFHKKVEEVLGDHQYSHVSKELGTDPKDGQPIVARYGQWGPYVQKGEGENRQYANLAPGQLIESLTLEEALKLFELPRTVGQLDGVDVVATKGRYGPYLKYGDKNVSLPRGKDPMTVTLEECRALIEQAVEKPAGGVLREFEAADIQIINGRYGPYLKHAGANYKLPKGTDVSTLTEARCQEIISDSTPTQKSGIRRRFAKRK